MTEPDLRAYVERARATVAESDDLSTRNTELRLVQPLLDALGWDVHGPDVSAEVAVPADRGPVNYALAVDGRPAVFVDVRPCADALREADIAALDAALAASDVDRGLLTNGRSFVFLARGGDREQCRLAELPDRADAVAAYTRAATTSRVEDGDERRAAAERIAARREDVADAVTDRLVAAADGAATDDLDAAVDRFLDDLLAELAEGDPASEAGDSDGDARESEAANPDDDSAEADDGRDAATTAGTAPDGEDRPGSDTGDRSDSDDGTGEYVVRFFDGRTSVGAVGTNTPVGATAAAVEYLTERHALDAGLSLPWRPDAADDDGRAVLNRDPVHPNGTPMGTAEPLSNGYHLLATLDAPSARTVVSELAAAAGLRTMFQGDW